MELCNIKGIGEKTEAILNKLNIYTIDDLVNYYPYKYNVYQFSNLCESEMSICVNAIIESNPTVFYIKKGFDKLSFRANVDGYIFNATIFNRAFLKPQLYIGKSVCLIGKYNNQKKSFICSDIKSNIKNGDIEPVYHLTKGLSNSSLIKFINNAITDANINDYLPSYLVSDNKLINKIDAIKLIHNPYNINNLKNAKLRLKYEEIFTFAFKMNFLKTCNKKIVNKNKNFNKEDIDIFINSLSFSLTNDQQKCVNDILDDLKSSSKMNRLILGDVGSGKTIISAIGIYANFKAGFQSTLMAPTEILALQHYNSLKKLFDKFNLNVDIVTGSMKKSEKLKIYERAASGEIDLLIGTHSLLNGELHFKNLGLIITDEQHRFGVKQRGILENKGLITDILYLSATPIPRTYAMTIYGDLDISMIKSKPMGRKDIITEVVKENNIKVVLTSMLEQIKKGHQVYIISPLVEDNDELNLSSVKKLKENIDTAFQNKIKTEILHGKMKQSQKDSIMNDFKNNQIKILISTTVIEVGIDVSNATTIVIYNAERFGLATLHQLRGRVGRNDLQCYCFLISDYENNRLHVMEESNDGFYISEKDFELRGHGDLFGTRQSGDMCFKIVDLKEDYEILLKANSDAENFIKSKEYLKYDYYKNIASDLKIVD